MTDKVQIDPLAALKVVSLERDTLRNALLISEHQNLALQREVERISGELAQLQALANDELPEDE